MKKSNTYAIFVFLIFYVSFGVVLTLNQERLIYQPWPQDFSSCKEFEQARKEVYKGTRMYVSDGEKGTAVLYHGNAGSACDRYYYAELFESVGYGYIIPEYAGYSNDSRKPSHERIKQDVRNVAEYINEQNVSNVVLVGESIGTGVASYHASLAPPEKLLLLSPFSSLADMAQRLYWYYPAFLMVKNAYDTMKLLQDYTGSVTIIHGDKDEIIPQVSGKKLYESLVTEQKRFVSVQGYGHNDILSSPQVISEIQHVLSDKK